MLYSVVKQPFRCFILTKLDLIIIKDNAFLEEDYDNFPTII
jgi:hypothetical protein